MNKATERHKWNIVEIDKYKCPKGIHVCEKCGLYKSYSLVNGYASYSWRLNSMNMPIYSISKNPGCDKHKAKDNKQKDDLLYVQEVYGIDYVVIYNCLITIIESGKTFDSVMGGVKWITNDDKERSAMIELMYHELIKGEKFDIDAVEFERICKLIGLRI